jgi:hypothetical protein
MTLMIEQQRSNLHIMRAAFECIYDWSGDTDGGWGIGSEASCCGMKYSNTLHLFFLSR